MQTVLVYKETWTLFHEPLVEGMGPFCKTEDISQAHNPLVMHFRVLLGVLTGSPLLLMNFKLDGLPIITVVMIICTAWWWV